MRKGMKGKGDRFVVFKEGALWHWHLRVANSPSRDPVAMSGRGYRSRRLVLKAIESAKRAARKAPPEPVVES